MSGEGATTESSSHTKFEKVKHVWTIDNFHLCFHKDGDEQRSSVFSMGGNDWRMRLLQDRKNIDCYGKRGGHYLQEKTVFCVELERMDTTKVLQKFRGDWKLLVWNGMDKQWLSPTSIYIHNIIVIDDRIQLIQLDDYSKLHANLKDDSLTLIFEMALLRDKATTGIRKKALTSNMRKKHDGVMKSLVENPFHSDVVLVSAKKEELRAHKCILAAHSRVFAAMFEANMRERDEGRVSIDDLSSSVLKKMLAFMYTGEAPDLSDADDATGLLGAAAKYEMDELKEFCAESLPEPTVENVCDMLMLAHLHEAPKLKSRARAFIKEHTDDVMKTEGGQELCKNPVLVQFVFTSEK